MHQSQLARPRKKRDSLPRHIIRRKPEPEQPKKQTEAERRAARFYRGNFDL